MTTRGDWLHAGLETLERHGAMALTIERLSDQLGVTKGSFYHHFAGMAGFKTALLAYYEAEYTTRFVDLTEEAESAGGMEKLRLLLDAVLTPGNGAEPGAGLEIAMRAWANLDIEVRDAQQRIDRTRMDYLRSLWQDAGGDPVQADQLSCLCYIMLIGASHLIPPLPAGELRRLYDLVLASASAPVQAKRQR